MTNFVMDELGIICERTGTTLSGFVGSRDMSVNRQSKPSPMCMAPGLNNVSYNELGRHTSAVRISFLQLPNSSSSTSLSSSSMFFNVNSVTE